MAIPRDPGHLHATEDLDGRLVLELRPDPSAASTARRALRTLLQQTGREEWSDSAELACTELVTNAVLHARTRFTLSAECSTTELRVSVSDTNPDLPRQRTSAPEATTGRGLLLIAQVTTEHGVHRDPAGKTVWFTIRGPQREDHVEPTADELLALWDDPDPAPTVEPDRPIGTPQPEGDHQPVRLVALPPSLWLAAEEHHRTLLRELLLYLADAEDPVAHDGPAAAGTDIDLAGADAALALLADVVAGAVEQARAAGTAMRPLPEEHPADLPSVPRALDLDLPVSPKAVWQFAALQDALDLAERLAVHGKLLARPGLPEIVAVRDWACEQVLAQSAGSPAGPWPGTDHERFTARDPDHDSTYWDIEAIRRATRPVVAADDSNRIVALSPAMADLVMWDLDDLTGRRIVTLIPPELRESHVAGFSRHLTTGHARLLGTPLVLPVLRADGHIIHCTVTIEQAAATGNRRLYLAHFEPMTGARIGDIRGFR